MSVLNIIPNQLLTVADLVKKGQSPNATVRELLSWFGFSRRGIRQIGRVWETLFALNLKTQPPFDAQYIDGNVVFSEVYPSAGNSKTNLEVEPQEVVESAKVTDAETALLPSFRPEDPTQRIGKLPSANKPPVSVNPEKPIVEAMTLMLMHDFSQLPVMTSERNALGIISWKSIGRNYLLASPPQKVRECIDECRIVESSVSLFDVVPIIMSDGCVLVRNSQKQICGIVTSSNINELFEQLAGPFLYLSEIENSIRYLIRGKFSVAELNLAKNPADQTREIERVEDLNFGEYIRLLQNLQMWEKLRLNIDRKQFTDQLEQIRQIRNDVMHFDPDGIDDSQKVVLVQFAEFLRVIRRTLDVDTSGASK